MYTDTNRLLAEFLHGKDAVHPNKFHEDWNELMQVVEKILNISLDLDSMELYYNITDNIPNIKQAYNSCVEFIKWYNN